MKDRKKAMGETKAESQRGVQTDGETGEKRGLGSVHSCQLLSLLLGYRPQTNGLKVSQEQK